MNPAYLIAALASVFYGSADFFGGMAAKRSPAPVVTLVASLAGLPVLLIALFGLGGLPTPGDIAWSVAAGLSGGIAAALIFRSLAIGPVSIASPVLSLTGMSLPVLVGFALGERHSPLAVGGLVLAAVAIPMLSMAGEGGAGAETGAGPSAAAARARADAPRTPIASRVLPVAFAAGIAAGTFLVCIGRIGHGAGVLPLVIARIVSIAFFTVWIAARGIPRRLDPGARGYSLGSGGLDAIANISYLVAVQQGSLALVAALVSLAPATAVLMARVFLGERWSVPQRWGLAFALIAGACISVG